MPTNQNGQHEVVPTRRHSESEPIAQVEHQVHGVTRMRRQRPTVE